GKVPYRQQLFISQQCRRPRDVQLFRQSARRWQARAWSEHAIEDRAADAAVHLQLESFGGARVDPNEQARRGVCELVGCFERHTGPSLSWASLSLTLWDRREFPFLAGL